METTLEIMKALSDRNRLRVVAALMDREELCACQISDLLQVAGATVSRHMDLLIRSGLVESRKDGRWVYYKLGSAIPASLFQWLKAKLQNDRDIKADRKTLIRIAGCK